MDGDGFIAIDLLRAPAVNGNLFIAVDGFRAVALYVVRLVAVDGFAPIVPDPLVFVMLDFCELIFFSM
jgi:hypothetical protein